MVVSQLETASDHNLWAWLGLGLDQGSAMLANYDVFTEFLNVYSDFFYNLHRRISLYLNDLSD